MQFKNLMCITYVLSALVACNEDSPISNVNQLDSTGIITYDSTYIWNGSKYENRVLTRYNDGSGFGGMWYINSDYKENEIGKSFFEWPIDDNNNNNYFVDKYLCEIYNKCKEDVSPDTSFINKIILTSSGLAGTAVLEDGVPYPYLGVGFYIGGILNQGYDISWLNGFCIEYSSNSDLVLMIIPENEYEITNYDNFQCKLPANTESTYFCSWNDFKRENWSRYNTGLTIDSVLKSASLIEFHFKKSISSKRTNFKISAIGPLNGCKK